MADYARGTLRGEKRDLEAALEGTFTSEQRWLLDKDPSDFEASRGGTIDFRWAAPRAEANTVASALYRVIGLPERPPGARARGIAFGLHAFSLRRWEPSHRRPEIRPVSIIRVIFN